MQRLKERLDESVAALIALEPYFAPNLAAARIILDGAKAGNTGLTWATGACAGPHGCTCGNRGCLHTTAWRIFSHGT